MFLTEKISGITVRNEFVAFQVLIGQMATKDFEVFYLN
jgi:hypothetical protein